MRKLLLLAMLLTGACAHYYAQKELECIEHCVPHAYAMRCAPICKCECKP